MQKIITVSEENLQTLRNLDLRLPAAFPGLNLTQTKGCGKLNPSSEAIIVNKNIFSDLINKRRIQK